MKMSDSPEYFKIILGKKGCIVNLLEFMELEADIFVVLLLFHGKYFKTTIVNNIKRFRYIHTFVKNFYFC